MRGLCVGVVGVCLLAACGGSTFDASQPKSTTTTTVAESPEAQALIAAATHGLENGETKPTPEAAQCMARALVDTVTVAKLKKAGVTKKTLEDPNADLPPALAGLLPKEQRIALGAAMQNCGNGELGALLAESFAKGLGNSKALDPAGRDCAKRWIMAPERRELIGSATVNADPSIDDARQLADLIVTCLDVSQVFAAQFHMEFTPTETTCIDDLARRDTDFRDSIAAEISGHPAAGQAPAHRFGVAILKCLNAEHLRQVSNASG